ncbi:MAG: hypothetical protein ACRDQ0_22920 [Pseudonocardia sp.]
MTRPDLAVEDCIEAAAWFLAQDPGAVARALDVHTPTRDGRCRGCAYRGLQWPCAVASSARRAAQLLSEHHGQERRLSP